MKFGKKVRYGRLTSVVAMSALLSTLLPASVAYADGSGGKDDGGGIVDTVKGWFTDDDDGSEAAAPPKGPQLDLPQHGRLPKGKKRPKPKKVKELKGRRTANARFWRMSDGTMQAELSAVPTAYKSGKSWKTIDTTVRAAKPGTKAKKQGFDFANTTNRGHSYFSSDPGKLLRIDGPGDTSVTFGLADPSGQKLKPKADGDTVTYENAAHGADFAYAVGRGRVKENITLADRPDGPVSFTFDLRTEHLTPKAHKDGSIAFYGKAPKPVMRIPAPFMLDAKKSASSPYGRVYSPDVEQKLTRHGDGWRLTITPDADWLQSKKRQYPVVIDPTVSITPVKAVSQDVMVLSGNPSVNYAPAWNMSVGNTDIGSARALLQFPLDEIPQGVDIKSARLGVYFDETHTTGNTNVEIEAHRATGPWTETGATWNNTSDLVGELSGTTVQLDDGDKGTAASGEWPRVGTLGGITVGNDYAYNKNSATGESYTWQPTVYEKDSYRVDVHYPGYSDATTAAPYTVHHDGTTSSYTVDQSAGGNGVWKTLDTGLTFDKGNAGKVVLGDTGDSSTRG
jgi:hypothetical protein